MFHRKDDNVELLTGTASRLVIATRLKAFISVTSQAIAETSSAVSTAAAALKSSSLTCPSGAPVIASVRRRAARSVSEK